MDTIPKRFIASLNDFGGRASQIAKHILSKAGFDALVATVQLGPCLLQKDHPQLIAMGLGESCAIFPAWDVVIDYDFLPLAIFADFHAVDAQVVLFVGKEQALDASWHL